jgi:hypothetical protein
MFNVPVVFQISGEDLFLLRKAHLTFYKFADNKYQVHENHVIIVLLIKFISKVRSVAEEKGQERIESKVTY